MWRRRHLPILVAQASSHLNLWLPDKYCLAQCSLCWVTRLRRQHSSRVSMATDVVAKKNGHVAVADVALRSRIPASWITRLCGTVSGKHTVHMGHVHRTFIAYRTFIEAHTTYDYIQLRMQLRYWKLKLMCSSSQHLEKKRFTAILMFHLASR